MKKIIVLVLVVVGILAIVNVVSAQEKVITTSKEGTTLKTWHHIIDKSTTEFKDTIAYQGGTSPLMLMDNVRGKTINGWYIISYNSLDTADGNIIDTTKDTCFVYFYTGAVGGTPSKVVRTDTIAAIPLLSKIINTNYKWVNIKSDSTQGRALWMKIVNSIYDNDSTLSDSSKGATYRFEAAFGAN